MNFNLTTMKIETISEFKDFVNDNNQKLSTAFERVNNVRKDKSLLDFYTLCYVNHLFRKNSKIKDNNIDNAISVTVSYYIN